MSYSKISSIALYVLASISLVIVLFFYIAPKTVNIDQLDARIEQLLTEGVIAEQVDAEAPAEIDSTAVDSLSIAEADSTTVAEADSSTTVVADSSTTAEIDSAIIAPPTEDQEATAYIAPDEINLRDYLSGWELMVYNRTDYALRWAYILFVIAALAALIFPLIRIVTDVKAIIKFLIMLAGVAVLVLFFYFVLASDTAISIIGYTGTDNSDPATLKWIGTGLFLTYFAFGMALLSILYSEIAKIFK